VRSGPIEERSARGRTDPQLFPRVARVLAAGNIEDFARIAFFLEQPNEVIVELKKLEAKLQERFSQRFGGFETKRKQYISSVMDEGLLTCYLNEWDAGFGFNALSNKTATTFPADFEQDKLTVATAHGNSSPPSFEHLQKVLPLGKAPTITGFAAPTLFRVALLRLGYHWKDPGAGEVHGDITHVCNGSRLPPLIRE
jgi:hypothetical protein